MNRLPPPNGDYEESQKDGNVGKSVGSDDLPEEFPPEDRIQPVEGSASYPRSSIIDGTNQDISAVPGAFLVPAAANPSNLDTPYGIAADNQAESEERVVLGDNLRSTPPGSGFLFLEAEAVQEYDVVEAQRVNSVVVSNETQRPLKWHQKTFYRVIVIGSIFLVGVIIVVVVLVTNSIKQQQATSSAPTQGPTAEPSTLEQMQVACDFLDVSLNTCITLTTFGSAVVGTSIPSEIALLTQLTKLVIENRDLGGIIPSSLGSLTLFTNLSLAKTSLTGTIPPSIASLTKLLCLYLYDNNLTGSIFSTIGSLTKLQRLSFSKNLLVDEIPGSFGSMAQLVRLDLDNNALTGSLPVTFGSLAKLTELRIFNNSMSSINFPRIFAPPGAVRISLTARI
ncbi:hypothetical protein MHU86_20522 [Fragilaria crotonensis]|nr:hypothetical protein MHU86_20522 [Fragilaria crotonensis]